MIRITHRPADPVQREDPAVRLHTDHLQSLSVPADQLWCIPAGRLSCGLADLL